MKRTACTTRNGQKKSITNTRTGQKRNRVKTCTPQEKKKRCKKQKLQRLTPRPPEPLPKPRTCSRKSVLPEATSQWLESECGMTTRRAKARAGGRRQARAKVLADHREAKDEQADGSQQDRRRQSYARQMEGLAKAEEQHEEDGIMRDVAHDHHKDSPQISVFYAVNMDTEQPIAQTLAINHLRAERNEPSDLSLG